MLALASHSTIPSLHASTMLAVFATVASLLLSIMSCDVCCYDGCTTASSCVARWRDRVAAPMDA